MYCAQYVLLQSHLSGIWWWSFYLEASLNRNIIIQYSFVTVLTMSSSMIWKVICKLGQQLLSVGALYGNNSGYSEMGLKQAYLKKTSSVTPSPVSCFPRQVEERNNGKSPPVYSFSTRFKLESYLGTALVTYLAIFSWGWTIFGVFQNVQATPR